MTYCKDTNIHDAWKRETNARPDFLQSNVNILGVLTPPFGPVSQLSETLYADMLGAITRLPLEESNFQLFELLNRFALVCIQDVESCPENSKKALRDSCLQELSGLVEALEPLVLQTDDRPGRATTL